MFLCLCLPPDPDKSIPQNPSPIFLSYTSILSCNPLINTAVEHKHQMCANIILNSSMWFKFQRSRPTHIIFIIHAKKSLCWSDKSLIHTQLLAMCVLCYVDLKFCTVYTSPNLIYFGEHKWYRFFVFSLWALYSSVLSFHLFELTLFIPLWIF